MSELSFEQMLEDSVKTIRNGEIVQGTVIDVKEDEIILNIGYKADGIITKNEYSNDASLVLTDAVHVGDTMEAKVLKVNDGEGQVTLTYKRLAAEKGNKRLEAAFESQEVLKAPVTQVLDGGLCVNVEEARVFIPASLVSDTYEKDLSKYADQEIEFVITEFNPRRRRIIGVIVINHNTWISGKVFGNRMFGIFDRKFFCCEIKRIICRCFRCIGRRT